jgi:Fe-S-cluster-containing hydrogenase component 2
MARIFVKTHGATRITLACLQCEDPICAQVCSQKAISRNPQTRAMEVNESLCIGCRLCTMSCPFGLVVMGQKRAAVKCDLCQGDPQCVAACTYGALEFAEEDTSAAERRDNTFAQIEKALASVHIPATPFSFPELKHS